MREILRALGVFAVPLALISLINQTVFDYRILEKLGGKEELTAKSAKGREQGLIRGDPCHYGD